MPFKSRKQMKYMFAKHPKIAKRWSKEYGTETVDEKVKKSRMKGRKK